MEGFWHREMNRLCGQVKAEAVARRPAFFFSRVRACLRVAIGNPPRHSSAIMSPLSFFFGNAADRPLLLLLAMALDAALGDMPWLFRFVPHPVVLIGRLIDALDRRLNKPVYTSATRRMRGVILVIFVGGSAALAGGACTLLARAFSQGWLLEVFIVGTLLAQRSLFEHVKAVAQALREHGLEQARQVVGRIVGRDPQSLDAHGVARAALESLAENFSDGVIAPLFWYLLLGLPGLLFYKAVNTLDSMVGYRNEKYLAFGWASARLDDGLNFFPARIAGLLLALAATALPKMRPLAALRTMGTDARHHDSPNAGWPEAAMAGALNLALGGPRRYPGLTVEAKWIGRGSARARAVDIFRALRLYVAACLIPFGAILIGLLGFHVL